MFLNKSSLKLYRNQFDQNYKKKKIFQLKNTKRKSRVLFRHVAWNVLQKRVLMCEKNFFYFSLKRLCFLSF